MISEVGPTATAGALPIPRDGTLSIAEVYNQVEGALLKVFPRGRSLWIRGEIQSVSVQPRSGHCFMDLIDPESAGERQAPVLRVKCWRGVWSPLRQVLADDGIELQPGMVVVMKGTLDFYRARAEIGFILSEIDVTSLIGRLAARRAALIKVLRAEGVLEANRLCAVPDVPLRIGLVASPGTEGYSDFLGQLASSGWAFHVLVSPVTVQGASAPYSVARGLDKVVKRGCDLVVLARGGGSKADLAAFDTEPVARAITASTAPVWTGIGHTGDQSVADVVANRACITPTECGRELVERVSQWWDESVIRSTRTLSRRTYDVLETAANHELVARRRLVGAARHQLRAHRERLATRTGRFCERGRIVPELSERVLRERASRLGPLALHRLAHADERLDARRRLLTAYDVDRQLERGYTLTFDTKGSIVRSVSQLVEGSQIVTRFIDGETRALVESVTPTPDRDGPLRRGNHGQEVQ